MQLNLPILEQLKDSENILIAGAGGGFDVFAGLPIYFTLHEMGKTVHLANYSFTVPGIVEHYCETIALKSGYLVGARPAIPLEFGYYPEGFLSQWFKVKRDEDVTVWMFDKTGAKTLAELYPILIEHLNIDALILIDGGVDSLSKGDEAGAGTFLEDSITLAAVEHLDLPMKILACLGFGAELEVCHHNALENIAEITKLGGFLGSCALTKQMQVYQNYEAACRYVWEQPGHKKSHINMRVVSSVHGEFDNHHFYNDYLPIPVFVSPLMSLYWFFDAQIVIERSLIVTEIRDSRTVEIALAKSIAFRERIAETSNRTEKPIPY